MFAGLDVGTTNVKFSVYDHDGKLVSQCSRAYGAGGPSDRICAERVWDCTKQVISASCSGLPSGAKIRAMAVSAFGECCIPVDAQGNPLCDCFLGSAPQGEEELKELLSMIPADTIRELTGLIPHHRFPLLRIHWYQKYGEIYDRAFRFLTMEDYIVCRLTGRFAISASSAGRTMMMDRNSKCWSSALLNAFNISPSKLPQIISSGERIGTVRDDISEMLALDPELSVFGGGHDQLCSAIGAGICTTGTAFNGSGTVECIAGLLEGHRIPATGTLPMQISDYPQSQLLFSFWAPVAGCSMLDWCLRTLYPDQGSGLELVALHRSVQECCGEYPSPVMAAPYLTGRNYPFLEKEANIRVACIRSKITREDIYQAFMEGICFEVKACLRLLKDHGIVYRQIVAAGGGARSDYWMQMKANIYGTPVMRMENSESGTLGAMMLAAVGYGEYASLTEAIEKCVRYSRTFLPDSCITEMYEEKFNQYLQFSRTSKGG